MENIIKLLSAICDVKAQRVGSYTDTKPILFTHDPKKVLVITPNKNTTKSEIVKQSKPFETVLNCDEIAQYDFFDDNLFELATQDTNMSKTVLEIDPYTVYYLYPVGTKIKVKHGGRMFDCCMLTTLTTYEYSSVDDVFCVSLSEITE